MTRLLGVASLASLCCMCLVLLSAATAAPVFPQWTPLPVGEVGDARCNVEEVELANEQQLSQILRELTDTTYFRLFQVDLNRKCKFWNKTQEDEEEAPTCSAPPTDDPGAGLPGVPGFLGGDDGDRGGGGGDGVG
eukprot:CAMPEP_0181370030 /NCGR_PEP_ID=MMETSP1106-20121128/13157_1 /TAXON_ID=81844 /ORGANISM="Mantoniella antarctica, Strain SL-175" /LENGTH=134 /DNA_ID=CAMNT_0023486693 /DNA_START=246 /DNA_END=646 /DNA_ORIENTATION=+